MLSWDFVCTKCDFKFDDLICKDDPYPSCTQCGGETEKCLGNSPTHFSPRQWEMKRKSHLIKQKILGNIPWRKSSWSQTD